MKHALILLAFVAAPTYAQVNRCETSSGVVYQQGACPGGSVVKVISVAPKPAVGSDPSPLAPPGPGKALCVAEAPKHFKDPGSVQIGDVGRVAQTMRYGVRDPGHMYLIAINAKNSYGGYVGEKNYWCTVTDDESAVLRFSSRVVD